MVAKFRAGGFSLRSRAARLTGKRGASILATRMKRPAKTRPGKLMPPARETPATHGLPVGDSEHGDLWGRFLQGLIFLVAFHVLLWRLVEVHLIYHGGGQIQGFPAFYWGGDFWREFWGRPNGVAEYLSALLAQSLFHSWWGALVLAIQAAVLLTGASAWLNAAKLRSLRMAAFALPILLLLLYARYAHFSAAVTALTLALACLALLARLPTDNRWMQLGGMALLTVVLYAAAARALPVFALCAVLLQWRRGQHWLMVLAPLATAAAATVALGWGCCGLGWDEAWQQLTPVPWETGVFRQRGMAILWAMFFGMPTLGLLAVAWDRLMRHGSAESKVAGATPGNRQPDRVLRRAGKQEKAGTRPPAFPPAWFTAGFRHRWLWEGLALLAVTLSLFYLCHDRTVKAKLATDYLVCRAQWAEAIESAKGAPDDPYVQCAVSQASYHLERLRVDLPTLRKPADLLIFDEQQPGHWRKSDLYLDLGYLNMALHHLIEAVEFWGERPLLLQRLALANLALGNTNTARIYLNRLTRVPFHGQWARDYLHRLTTDPALAGYAEVQRLRRLMPKQDTVVRLTAPEVLLLLLQANPQNRMALDYLITYQLLARNVTGVAEGLRRLNDFPDATLSPLWQDAALLAASAPAQRGARQERPSPEAQQRFEAVRQVISACQGDKQAARNRLHNDYGRSYFFYYYLGP